jgi:hypothetical protein
MKFLLNNDIHKNRVLLNIIRIFILFMLFYLVSSWMVERSQLGANLEELMQNLLGDSELFIEPLSLIQILEFLHLKLFLYLILIMMNGAILFQVSIERIWRNFLALLPFLLLFIDTFSLLGGSYVSPMFITVKLVTMSLLPLVMVLQSIVILFKLR